MESTVSTETEAVLTTLNTCGRWNGFDEKSRAEMTRLSSLVEAMLDAVTSPEEWNLVLAHHRFTYLLMDCPMISKLSREVSRKV